MITHENRVLGTIFPGPNPSSPGVRPGKSNQEEAEDEDDPLFEEEETFEDFEEDGDDEYEINDRFSKGDLADILDYMNSSL